MGKKKSKTHLVKQNEKIKVLAYCDAPTCATGFSTVSRNILSGLYASGKYKVDILGINYWGDPHNFPFRIWPTGLNSDRDPYGRKKVFDMIQKMDFDILFFLQDTFILNFLPDLHRALKAQGREFKSVCFSGDTEILTREGIKNIKDVKIGDLALSYDTESKETLFKPVTKVYEVPFEGEMININGLSANLSVTPDHKMYMTRNGVSGWTNAEEMYNRANSVTEYFPNFSEVTNNKTINNTTFELYKHIDKSSIVVIKPVEGCAKFRKDLEEDFIFSGDREVSKCGKVRLSEYDHHINGYKVPLEKFVDNKIDLLEFKDKYNCKIYLKSRTSDRSELPIIISMEDFIKLSAWYITEGCCTYYTDSDGNKIYNELSLASNIAVGREINYRQHIKGILDSTGIKYREKEKDFLLKGTTLTKLFKEYFGNGASNKRFPDWFLDLDIKYLKILFEELLKGDGHRDKSAYTTKSKTLVAQITLLAFMLGIKAHYKYYEDRDVYVATFTYKDSGNFPGGIRRDNFSKEHHNGTVYCVEVEDTHTVFAGREGYFSITGQCYYPIDGTPKQEWIKNVEVCDYIVTYSHFAKVESLKVNPGMREPLVIPHGANTRDFHVLPEKDVKAFRAQYFGSQADKFVYCNLNRNQQRKDIPRTIAAFKEFRKQVPNSLLYCHMAKKDQGWDLVEVVKANGLSISEDVVFPENFGPNQGYPVNIVNMIYNASDCIISTSLGEGFGLCVHPKTNVYTERGIKDIKDITVYDKVLSSDGTYNEVECVMSRNHKGKLYEVTTWMSNIPLRTSPEHGYKIYDSLTNSYTWKKAEELNIGDMMVFPKSSPNVSIDTLEILPLIKNNLNIRQLTNIEESNDRFRIQSNFKNPENLVPKKIRITKSIMHLFGLYLAEGSLNTRKMDSVTFSFHKEEENLLEFVKSEMLKVFGLSGTVQLNKRPDYNGISISFYSSVVANLFYTLFGSGARNKKIHPIIINQPSSLIKEFLYGEFLGDGSYGSSTYELSFSTTSKHVAYGLRLLLAHLGVISSVRTSRVEYKVNVSGTSKRTLLDLFNIKYDKDRKWENGFDRATQNDDFLLLPIKDINVLEYEGKLIDIQVSNTNDFVAENMVVHNSWIEGMTTKTPVIMPNNTMMSEFITEDRGWLADSGTNPSLFTVVPNDNEVVRPLVDVDDMVKKMLEVYNNPEEVKRRVNNAYNWAITQMDWQMSIVPQWLTVFDQAVEDLKTGAPEVVEEGEKVIETETF